MYTVYHVDSEVRRMYSSIIVLESIKFYPTLRKQVLEIF